MSIFSRRFRRSAGTLIVGVVWIVTDHPSMLAEVSYNETTQLWSLTSGPVQYRLRQVNGIVELDYFGPIGGKPWDARLKPRGARPHEGGRYDIQGSVNGQALAPENLTLIAHEIRTRQPGVEELRLVYRHGRLPARIEAVYTAWNDTGVFTRELTIANNGNEPLSIEQLPSVSWLLPNGAYELTYLWGSWGRERQVASETLGPGQRSFVSTRGRSTSEYSAWFALHNRDLGSRYVSQLAYSGNWQMTFERQPENLPLNEVDLHAALGIRFDFGGPLILSPSEAFTTPAVAFTATTGLLDDATNQLHRYQREYVIPRIPTNDPLLVQFNSWYPYRDKLNLDVLKMSADVAADLGVEVFVLDAGWFTEKDWSREIGDWEVNRKIFPRGLQELAEHVRSRGMKFGIWVEIENLGIDSRRLRDHPDWVLKYQGEPLRVYNRYHLDFSKPEVRAWARSVVDHLVKELGIEWMKVDYNINAGERFDAIGSQRRGAVLYSHLSNYYQWLDEIRTAYPGLVIENCSSGGLRFDLGIMGHAHTSWLSDVVDPKKSVQLAYGCTLEFAPEVCNHWMVGETDDGVASLAEPSGWWDFMFRAPMNGQFGLSSRLLNWNENLKRSARRNIALYKRIRRVIKDSDVYHLTPPPSYDRPTDWSALQHVSRNGLQSVVKTYRLEESSPNKIFKLRGLIADRLYRVLENGEPGGEFTGQKLQEQGLAVHLEDEWRASIFELKAEE